MRKQRYLAGMSDKPSMRFSTEQETEALEQPHVIDLQRSLRKFVIVMCMMIEIKDSEGVQKRCPPKKHTLPGQKQLGENITSPPLPK